MTVRGACPTLAKPMMTGDGLLVRLALARPGLSAEQLGQVARAAADHGNGLIEITARGNIQIRGLNAQSAPAFAARIEALNVLTLDSPAILVNPLAEVDPTISANPLAIADAIRQQFNPAMTLAAKMTIVVDGGGLVPLCGQVADIRVVAAGGQWQLAVAGDEMSAVPLANVDEDDAALAVLLLLKLLAARGESTRALHLLQEQGPGPFIAALAPVAVFPAIAKAAAPPAPIIGPHAFAGGSPVLGIALTFGQTDAASLLRLAQAAQRFNATSLCPAPDHSLLITGMSDDGVSKMIDLANALGLITDPADPHLNIAACTGKPGCASGYLDTRALARQLAMGIPDLTRNRRHLHVSGCAKGCARALAADVVLVGQSNGLGIVLQGRADGVPISVLSHAQPSALVAQIVEILETTP